jgi:hypothetical protein
VSELTHRAISNLLFAFFGLIMLGNIVGMVLSRIRRRNFSYVLFLGGLAGLFGVLSLPGGCQLPAWWWLPPVADVAVPCGLWFSWTIAAKVYDLSLALIGRR